MVQNSSHIIKFWSQSFSYYDKNGFFLFNGKLDFLNINRESQYLSSEVYIKFKLIVKIIYSTPARNTLS